MKVFNFDKEIELCGDIAIDWKKIDNKTIMITGATGLIGKYLIEVLLCRNKRYGKHTKVVAVGRSEEKFRKRFLGIDGLEQVEFLKHDIQQPLYYEGPLDFIIHMASNTHPRQYAMEPIATEMTNIMGTYYLLKLASERKKCRFVFTSSVDIYGNNKSANKYLSEQDCGYIDCNTLRAGYIEGKRASEALCNAFFEEKGVDFVTARICRVYGPTMQMTDSRAISQFIQKAITGEDIILKSQGTQIFSYLYVYDVVSALFTIMEKGICRNVYNVADNNQVISLKDLATIIAKIGKSTVVFGIPDQIEAKGASSLQNACLDATKLYGLGWKAEVNLENGLYRTVATLKGEKQ